MELEHRFAATATQETLHGLRQEMGVFARLGSHEMEAMARGYAWAHTDATGYVSPAHGGDALDFSVAYAIHITNPRGYKPVRDAYSQWVKEGKITREY